LVEPLDRFQPSMRRRIAMEVIWGGAVRQGLAAACPVGLDALLAPAFSAEALIKVLVETT
jgi:hypothetical protein